VVALSVQVTLTSVPPGATAAMDWSAAWDSRSPKVLTGPTVLDTESADSGEVGIATSPRSGRSPARDSSTPSSLQRTRQRTPPVHRARRGRDVATVTSPLVKLNIERSLNGEAVSYKALSVQFSVILGCSRSSSKSPRGRRRPRRHGEHERVHEVHLFVGQDVAVPHYSHPKLTKWFRIEVIAAPFDRTPRRPGRAASPFGQRRVDQPHAIGNFEGNLRRRRPRSVSGAKNAISRGLILKVSFQPVSPGPRQRPVRDLAVLPTRLIARR